MLRFWAALLIIKLTLSGAAYAQQPTPPSLIKQCAEKYLTAKAANMIGSILEGDFLKVCTVTAGAGSTAPAKQNKPLPPEIQLTLNKETKSCGQKVKLKENFITRRDVNGDGIDDFILDFGWFICGQNSGSDYCGSGGCLTQVFVSRSELKFVKVFEDVVQSLKFAEVNERPALVLELHGSACGKAGFEPCSKTLIWTGQKFSPETPTTALANKTNRTSASPPLVMPPLEKGLEISESKPANNPEVSLQGTAAPGLSQGGTGNVLGSSQARPVPPRLPSPGTEVIGNWNYITTVDKLTDKVGFIAAIKSIDDKYTLGIKCEDAEKKSVYAMLLSPIYLGQGTTYLRSIQYRLDQARVTEEKWHFEQSYAANFDHIQAKNFALNIMRSSRLVMKGYSWDFSASIEPEFNIEDSEAAIKRVLTDCKS